MGGDVPGEAEAEQTDPGRSRNVRGALETLGFEGGRSRYVF